MGRKSFVAGLILYNFLEIGFLEKNDPVFLLIKEISHEIRE